jgi:hypothetical protein
MASQKQRNELPAKLVALQMEAIGKTYEDAISTVEFWKVYTMTKQQNESFRKNAIALIKKVLRCNKSKAIVALDLFMLDIGLRVD